MKSAFYNQFALAGILCFCFCANSVRANVYATDIRLNGSLNAGVVVPGQNLTISYILNDTATGGVWVRIYSGATVIQTLTSAAEQAGTNTGLNSVVWPTPTNLAQGIYMVSITAASLGYETWTNITDDGPDFYVEVPSGISVNQNTNSPYYGRVYVGDALFYWDSGKSGILKYNADGSPADEGGFSTGGWGWTGGGYSPWKMTIGINDRVYIDDFANQGVVVSFDATIGCTDVRQVVRTDNYPSQDPNVFFSGLALTESGTNAQIWMTDEDSLYDQNPYGSAGIVGWNLNSQGVAATGDMGTSIVPIDSDFLTQAPYDLSLGSNGFIYTIQYLTSDSPAYALMSFPPYAGEQETNADWAVSDYPTLLNCYGVAVNPANSLVAVAVESPDFEEGTNGGLYLYNATDGDFITDVDQSGGTSYWDVAWDRVGNLYTVNPTVEVWRVYSPPGTNQATTVAVPFIQSYSAILAPTLADPVASPGMLQFVLEGQSNVTYTIQCSSDLINWTNSMTNFSANVDRNISIPASGSELFYRAVTSP
jgi:hypothetical protein